MLNLIQNAAKRAGPGAPFEDVLTSPTSGHDIGRSLGGLRAGPTLLVATGPGLYAPLHRRLAALPSLPWMRGRLLLIRLSDAEDGLDEIWVDDMVCLPQEARNGATVPAAYWTVLRKATAMGMIDGRGVPLAPVV